MVDAARSERARAQRQGPKYPEVEVQLEGEDGNAFSILGRVRKAMRRAGVDASDIKALHRRGQGWGLRPPAPDGHEVGEHVVTRTVYDYIRFRLACRRKARRMRLT